jgi:hypothetical protein
VTKSTISSGTSSVGARGRHILVKLDGGSKRTTMVGDLALNQVSSGGGVWASTEATDTFSGAGSPNLAGAWASTEATDTIFAKLFFPPSGLFTTSEQPDTWATAYGLEILQIENVQNVGASFNYTNSGPNRIVVLVFASVGVGSPVSTITGITGGGLTWSPADFVQGAVGRQSEYTALEFWWAYAHNKVVSQSISVSRTSGSTTTATGVCFSVAGLNGNYTNPFCDPNPLSHGSGMGAFGSGESSQPQSFLPVAIGPLATVLSASSFDPTTAQYVTLSNGNLTVTSDGTNPHKNSVTLADADRITSGTRYHECTFHTIAGSNYAFGITHGTATPNDTALTGKDGLIVKGDGTIWNVSNAQVGSLGSTPVNGDVIAMAINADASKGWFRNVTQNGLWNNNVYGDPALNIGGFSFLPDPAIIPMQPKSIYNNYIIGPGGMIGRWGGIGIGILWTAGPTPPAQQIASIVPISLPDGTSNTAKQIFNFGATAWAGTPPAGFNGWGATASATRSSPYWGVILDARMSITNFAGTEDVLPPSGFTNISTNLAIGSQRTLKLSVNTKVISQGVLTTDNEFLQQLDNTPTWLQMYDTMIVGAINPGAWVESEAADRFSGVGYPSYPSPIGDLLVTEAKDVFNGNGFEADSGALFTTELKDIFVGHVKVPNNGTFVTTGAIDRFVGAGIGRGEDGIFVVSEARDVLAIAGPGAPVFAMFGDPDYNRPDGGWFEEPVRDETDNRDTFLANGLDAVRVRKRRVMIVN